MSRINDKNVGALGLAWVYRADAGSTRGGGVIKSTPLQVDGVLYFSVPNHVWAVDARTGRERWHYIWPSKGGITWPIGEWRCSATGCSSKLPTAISFR